jgi:hypothetical protein
MLQEISPLMKPAKKTIKIIGETLRGTPLFPLAKYAHTSVMYPKNYTEVLASEKINTNQNLKRKISDESKNAIEVHELNLEPVEQPGEEIDWKNGWHTVENVIKYSPGFLQPNILQPSSSEQYFCFYEYRGKNYQWHIGVTVADNVLGPYTTHHFPILAPSGKNGCPAEMGIADPTVLCFEDSDPSWHMWFDMRDRHDVWRIGHATSTDGIDWKICRGENDRPAAVIDIGERGAWDDGFVHAPEAFIYNDKVRLIYNAQGSGHQNYDGGLAIASDPAGRGFEFSKVGQTTFGDTALGGSDIRVKQPIRIRDTFYALHSRDVKGHATICRSNDGCETWDIVESFPYPYGNSFIREDSHLICIGADKNMYVKRLPESVR